jgi:hypothetical protein
VTSFDRLVKALRQIQRLSEETDPGDRLDPDGELHVVRRKVNVALYPVQDLINEARAFNDGGCP